MKESKANKEITPVTTPNKETTKANNHFASIEKTSVLNSINNSSDLEVKKIKKEEKKYVYVRPQNKDDLLAFANQKITEKLKKEN